MSDTKKAPIAEAIEALMNSPELEHQRPLNTLNTIDHVISPNCSGVKCFCGAPATHKVGEEGLWLPDDKEAELRQANKERPFVFHRHNWTCYICCEHFGQIMGPVVQDWCNAALQSEFDAHASVRLKKYFAEVEWKVPTTDRSAKIILTEAFAWLGKETVLHICERYDRERQEGLSTVGAFMLCYDTVTGTFPENKKED